MIIDTSPSNVMALKKLIKELKRRQEEAITAILYIANELSYQLHYGDKLIEASDITDLDEVIAILKTGEKS